MKKFTPVYLLVAIFASTALFAGCSSAPMDESEEASAPVEAAANNEAFNSLVNSDPAASADSGMSSDPGAVVDSSSPVVAANTAEAPTYTSPVNLGASSAGRAH